MRIAVAPDQYRFKALGAADDLPHQQADGSEVLTYQQALRSAGEWDPYADHGAGGGPLEAVGDFVRAYLEWFKQHRKSYERTRCQAEAHILDSELADVPVERLTASRLRRWLYDLARKPARVRTAPGDDQQHKGGQDERARRATANRVWTILRAALNRAWKEGAIKGEPVWRRVEPFRDVEQARTRYLDRDEIERLLNAIDGPAFQDLVQGALYTGMRYGELCRLRVEDVDVDAGAVLVRESKAPGARHVFLNDEGLAFFESLAAGRDGGESLLRRRGREWRPHEQVRPIRDACHVARIEGASFHTLRHTYASLYLMGGGGLADLAKQLGHTSTRMVETTYGHLADKWRAERARQFAPTLGKKARKVRRIGAER